MRHLLIEYFVKLVSTTISNFRSITSAYKVQLHNFTVLVGPNNEGKSNVLAAISLTLSLLEGGQFRFFKQVLRYRYSPTGESFKWDRDFPIRLQATQAQGEAEVTLQFSMTAEEKRVFAKETKVNLESDLKIKVAFGPENARAELLLQGQAKKKLPENAINAIAKFIAENIMLKYIPAVRTVGMAEQVINEMLQERLAVLEKDSEFLEHVTAIEKLQAPLLKQLGTELQKTIAGFVPEVNNVNLSTSQSIARALRSTAKITIDDGAATPIQMKGDGIKSLLAIALMKHWSESRLGTRSLILAVEEPESHLHPYAVHRLRDVLRDVAVDSQVILTTHSAPLVDREVAARNIIVRNGSAKSAESLKEVRDALGIKQSDNLTSARLVLVVEGSEDERILRAWLAHQSPKIKHAISAGDLAIDVMGGCTNLEYKARLHAANVSSIRVLLDNDDAGRAAYEKAEANGAVKLSECTMTSLPGYKNSELEDLVSVAAYLTGINEELGVNFTEHQIEKNDKKFAWSERMKVLVEAASKPWSKKVEAKLKEIVSARASSSPSTSLNPKRIQPINSLITSIEAFFTV
jgi:putative ATP-dependent endonuclease of the OLD family